MIKKALHQLKHTTSILFAISLIIIIQFIGVINVLAIQTNVNKVTDLFDKNIEDKDVLFDNLKAQNNNAISEINSKVGVNSIEGINEAEGKIAELNGIKETDLDNTGRDKRASKEYRFYDENELEPDYTKPGNSEHKLDSDDIISLTNKKMREIGVDFMAKLKEEGFDCKTVKGSVVKEPVYYIETKKEIQKNTEYDQLFCEEPRNTYNCKDTVTLRCAKRGMQWNPWQYRTVHLPGDYAYHGARHLGYPIHWKKKRNGWHITTDSAGWRSYLSGYLGIPLNQIHEQIHFPGGARGIGGTHFAGGDHIIVFDAYILGYNYRDGHEICEQWSEDWNERCYIK